ARPVRGLILAARSRSIRASSSESNGAGGVGRSDRADGETAEVICCSVDGRELKGAERHDIFERKPGSDRIVASLRAKARKPGIGSVGSQHVRTLRHYFGSGSPAAAVCLCRATQFSTAVQYRADPADTGGNYRKW